MQNALDLINRQKADIDFSRNINHLQMEELQTAKAAIERLKAECGNQSTLWSQHYESIFETSKETIKTEAIKEFADKLKNKKQWDIDIPDYVFVNDIDNLVKEMAGDTE